MHVRVRISCVDVGVNMYVCTCVCAYACAHACISIWFKNVQHISLTPSCWGGPYPSLKMASVWSSLCSFSVRNRTGGKPRFDAQMWGGPYPSLKMVSVWSSLCSFSVRNRPGGKLREFSGVNHQARNQKWQEHFPVRASMLCARAYVCVLVCLCRCMFG